MKIDFLTNKKELLPRALLWFSAGLGIVVIINIAGFFVNSAKAARVIDKAAAQSQCDPNDVNDCIAKYKAIAEELKKKNLFVPPAPKKHPVSQVIGILGKEVLINGKFYKVGDKIGDANVLAIEPARVKIEWDGKEKWFAPFDAASKYEPKKFVKKAEKEVKKNDEDKKIEKIAEIEEASEEDDPLGWMGVELSAALRVKLLEKWNTLTDEQKQQYKDQWNALTDEQKQEIVAQMEANIDNL
ncbi:hypothetical protein ACFL3G_04175 [Planctomycetota bacterium]